MKSSRKSDTLFLLYKNFLMITLLINLKSKIIKNYYLIT